MPFKGINTCILVSTMLRKIDQEYEEQCMYEFDLKTTILALYRLILRL